MPAVQVRDMPDELYGRLKNSAKTNHRSLSQELRYVLEQSLMPAQEHQWELRTKNEDTCARIETRREVFAALSELNAQEKSISSQEIEQIYWESKQEFDGRTTLMYSLDVEA